MRVLGPQSVGASSRAGDHSLPRDAVTESTVPCAHCGLDAPAGAGGEEAFCCSGCRSVFELIHAQGWHEYYELKTASGTPAAEGECSYQEYDHPTFREAYAHAATDGCWSMEWAVPQVHCAACVWLVERVLREGGCRARVDLGRQRVTVTWSPAEVSLAKVARRLDRFGYRSAPWKDAGEKRRRSDRLQWIRLAVCGACAANAMFLAFALYAGVVEESAQFAPLFRWASLWVSLPSVLWGGMVFYRGAFAALRYRVPHIDLPIAVAIVVAMVVSSVNVVRGSGEIYFDTIATLIFLLLVGRLLQQRQQRRAAESSALLEILTPHSACRWEGGEWCTVPVLALEPGDRVVVQPAEAIPADGVVCKGRSVVNKSLLTGESDPQRVDVGSEVCAGFDNLEGVLEISVEKVGEETRAGRLAREVEAYCQRRGPIQELANRCAGVFVGVVLALAVACGVWWWFQDPTQVVEAVVALLVVSCPCALGLATPLVVSAAVGQLARLGIWVKGGAVLEGLAQPGMLWLDKTGTVTEGKPVIQSWHRGSDAAQHLGGESVALQWAAALERDSKHPLARAFAGYDENTRTVSERREQRGGGLEGTIDGVRLQLGSVAFVDVNRESRERVAQSAEEIAGKGLTPVVLACDGEWWGTFSLGDALRQGVRQEIARLVQQGWSVGLLSGDHPRAVARCGAELGLPAELVVGGQEPEAKAERVAASPLRPVVMVGDGINDTVALAAADVGIAVGGAAELTLRSADVTSSELGLDALGDLLSAARRARHVIYRNVLFSLCYNVVGISLAFVGVMDPLGAAILMPFSSLTVVLSSYRARYAGGASQRPAVQAAATDGDRRLAQCL